MNSIIFGGSGFIGTHLHHLLKAQGLHLICDIERPNDITQVFNYTDVRQKIEISTKEVFSVIFNLAAVHTTPGHTDEEYFQTNILGAENVCQFARETGINTIVFTSSIAPYGASEDLKTEDSLPTPNSPYGISKLIAEEIHKRWQAEDMDKRRLIILRPGVVFGKGESGNFTRLYNALYKRLFFYPGRRDTRKSCIYVKDLVDKMVCMAKETPPSVQLYNMCYPEPHSIEQIISTMASITGTSNKIPLIPSWFLKVAATIVHSIGKIVGLNMQGIHPERVSKLMMSTNISGDKLDNSTFALDYSLERAITDWYIDCGRKMLC